MIAFALLACIMSVGGVYAALEANRMTVEDAWASVDLDLITAPTHAVTDSPAPVVQTQTL
jgi:hypothetical protein